MKKIEAVQQTKVGLPPRMKTAIYNRVGRRGLSDFVRHAVAEKLGDPKLADVQPVGKHIEKE
ncbi:hypothetical protein K0U83_22715 [bacterium]|nr:hypothetical protein [bacterium]